MIIPQPKDYWLSNALRNSKKHKNKLYLTQIKAPTITNQVIYTKYKNKLCKLLKAAEKLHYRKILDANKNNLKKTWATLKIKINKSKCTPPQKSFKIG